MNKKEAIVKHIKDAKELKILGESLEETVVIKKVNDMNSNSLFKINYELLEFMVKDSEEFTNEEDFINRVKELIDSGVKFNKYDYYNKTEVW